MMRNILLILCLLSVQPVFGQYVVNQIPPSPTAASLTRYALDRVDYSSGSYTPNIPLFELDEMGMPLTISLDYRYSGFKPSEIAGITGLGWNLMAGGVISRVIRGKKDESGDGYYSKGASIASYINNYESTHIPTSEIFDMKDGSLDSEPDMFYFNFDGYSGSFFWGADGEVHLHSQQKIKIEVDYDIDVANRDWANHWLVRENFTSFTLTTADGTIYKFGACEFGRTTTVELINGGNDDGTNMQKITAWYLTEMIGRNGQRITFDYTLAPGTPNRLQISQQDQQMIVEGPGYYYNTSQRDRIMNFSHEIYLTKISGTGWEIALKYDDLSPFHYFAGNYDYLKQLKKLSLYDTNGLFVQKIKSYELSYQNKAYSFLLKEVAEKDADDNLTKPPYQFSYFGLPNYVQNIAVDLFGFYNGDISLEMFPENGANRIPDKNSVTSGALMSIVNPSGGKQFIEYELNEFSYLAGEPFIEPASIDSTKMFQLIEGYIIGDPLLYVNQNININILINIVHNSYDFTCSQPLKVYDYGISPKADLSPYNTQDILDLLNNMGYCLGTPASNPHWDDITVQITVTTKYPYVTDKMPGPGIRIKQITQLDDINPNVVTEFEYQEEFGTRSSGEVYALPFTGLWAEGDQTDAQFYSSDAFNSMSKAPVTYSRVVKKVNQIPKEVHRFTSHAAGGFDNELGNPFQPDGITEIGPYADYGPMRGRPKSITLLNDSLPISSHETFYYSKAHYKADSFYQTPALYIQNFAYFGGSPYDIPVTYIKFYKPVSFWFYPEKEEQREYDDQGQNPQVQTTELYYDNLEHQQLSRKKLTLPDGTIREESFKYPADYSSPGSSIDSLIAHHRHNSLIEYTLKLDGIVKDAKLTTYGHWPGNSRKASLTLPDAQYQFKEDSIFTSFDGSTSDAGSYYLTEAVLDYDTLGQTTLTQNQSGLKTAIVRAYNGKYPVIIAQNTSLAAIDAALAGQSSIAQIRALSDTATLNHLSSHLRNQLDTTLVSSYLYRPLIGLSAVTEANGLKTTYNYDSFGRLSSIRDHNNSLVQQYSYQLKGDDTNLYNQVVSRTLRVDSATVIDAGDPNKALIQYQFYDGFGQDWQKMHYQQSPQNKNVFTEVTNRDIIGRPDKQYLPLASINTDTLPYLYPATLEAFSYSDDGYSRSEYYGSSDRIRYGRMAGTAWYTNDKKTEFYRHTTQLPRYTYNGNIQLDGSYATHSVLADSTVDEQGNATIVYTDVVGRKIATRQWISLGEAATTVYIYNGQDRLVAVIQPEGVALNSSIIKDSDNWKKYVFAYEYDEKNREKRKHIPGAGWIDFVYDKADRQVLQQDAKQKVDNLWSFTKYDPFGRMAFTGEYQNTTNRSIIQAAFDAYAGNPNEIWLGAGGYNGGSYPLAHNPDANSVKNYYFYDQYDFVASLNPDMTFKSSGAYHAVHSSAKGLATGSVSYNQDTGDYYVTALYYNDNGRVIQQQSTHPKTTDAQPDRIDYEYNFAGDVLRGKRLYKTTGEADQTLITRNEYDHAGRLIKTFLSLNDQPEKEIIQYTYDEIGRLKQKIFIPNENFVLGNPDYIYRPPNPGKNQEDLAKKAIILEPGTVIRADTLETYLAQIDSTSLGSPFIGLQTIDYNWHIRGGLRGINLNPSGSPVPDLTKGDLFAYKLDYETAGQWNGNIGKQSWNHVDDANPVGIRDYTYSYDGLDRLKSATYSGLSGEDYSVSGLNYDRNGNILNLERAGKMGNSYGLIDNLTYTYNGNRLTKVTDAISGDYEVDFVMRGSGNYTYYENGALKSDENKEIANVIYNTFLNLPTEIYLTGGRWIKNTYLGDGTLIKRTFSNGDVWEYNNGLIFKNGEFYSIDIPEGRAVYESGDWKYEFYYEDHLGNKRATFAGENGILVKKDNVDFDPWGVRLNGADYSNSLENRFKYQDKESLALFGLENVNDFSARYFDRSIGRFWGVDPLADHPNQLGISPYAFSNNNPINMIDPDGRMATPCCGDEDPTKDQFLFAKLAATAFYDTKHAVYNTAFRVFRSDLRAGYKVENGKEVFETTFTRKTKDNSFSGVLKEGASALTDGVLIFPGGNITGKLFAQTGKSQGVRTGKTVVESATSFVVTPKGEIIQIPKGATGPINPEKGSGMVYKGGAGGKDMDKRVSGVRIMDANSNQGRRVNYMNHQGQTVDPKTGRTISNKDKRGHIPLKDY